MRIVDTEYQPTNALYSSEGLVDELMDLGFQHNCPFFVTTDDVLGGLFIKPHVNPEELPEVIRTWLAERMVEAGQTHLEWRPIITVDDIHKQLNPCIRLYWSGQTVRAMEDGSWRLKRSILQPIKRLEVNDE